MATSTRLIAITIAVLLLVLSPHDAIAQSFQSFQPRYTTVANGDMVLLANTNMTCQAPLAGSCPAVNNKNDGQTMVNSKLPADATDASIFNSSSATLTTTQLPVGAQVVKAMLYWGGHVISTGGLPSPNPSNSPVRLGRAGGSYQSISPQACHVSSQISIWSPGSGFLYSCHADVTQQVQATGTYNVANVPVQNGTINRFGGWTMVLVVRNPTRPLRRFTINDGLVAIATTGGSTSVRSASVTVSGFQTPLSGPVSAQLAWLAFDGDTAAQDGFTFQGQGSGVIDISDSCNPLNEVFNSTICNFGTPATNRNIVNGNGSNTLGFDADLVQVPNPNNINLGNGATSAVLTARTSSEGYGISMLAMAVDVYQPSFDASASKTQANLTNPGLPVGQALPGDEIRYTVVLENVGQDNARDVVIRDAIPANTDYVPGSLEIVSGANPGTKTDTSGDDQAELAAGDVVFRVGTGANATNGGIVRCDSCLGTEPTDITITFKVRVRTTVAAGTVIRNTARLEFVGVSSGQTFTENSNETVLRVQAPPRLTLSKVINGRAVSTDQFTVSISGGGPSATTTGSATTATTAAFTATAGTTYTLSESPAGTPLANLANYNTSYSCVNAEGGTTEVPPGTSTSFSVTPVAGDDITCTFTNTRKQANLSITKTNTPGVSNTDQAIDTVVSGTATSYTILVTNNGPDAANGALVRDPAPTGLTCASASCSVTSGSATCPASTDITTLQGTGVISPTMPASSSVTFTVQCTVQ